ncbi:LOW QUALITY PROTEIN: major facilitator superfamily domain-containing protein 6-like [Camarhynchus parvulus]|uniref:LOW QUALITY PROTEIN: major facilitator superfamily domain-containing protein 6-like n=1 Tax=Geospiza parvula TaxID=87175 RepID=UPI001237C44C|nr:LOW QUALITY PROTEIN: major facilitator superfamily domain-containing protein 6-like [Camarhynchus parvulus]
MSERWDVGRALALAALFRLLQGAGRGCAEPFLPLYLRLLGLPAPLLGAAAGARLLAALAVPLCCPRGRAGRLPLLLTAGSALGSVGASLALTLIPPAGHTGHTGCSLQLGLPGARPAPLPSGLPSALPSPVPSPVPGPVPRPVPTAVPGPVPSPGRSSDRVLNPSAPPHTRAVPGRAGTTAADVSAASREPAVRSSASQGLLGTAGALQERGRGAGEGDPKGKGSLDGSSGRTVEGIDQQTPEPGGPASYGPPSPGLQEETPGSAATNLADNAEESLNATASNEAVLFKTALPAVADAHVSENLSDSRDASSEAAQSISQDREYQVFLMVLCAVVLWELLATFLEWAMDENVYEYLDFADATDRHGRLWPWGCAGAAAGACGVSVLVDRLPCSFGGSIPRLAVHFYAHAVLVLLSLAVSISFPSRAPGRSARAPGLPKALSLLRGHGRALLLAGTLFLVGAASSASHNFLPWQLQDQGSSELLVGLWVALGPLAELALHPLGPRLLRALPGGGAEALGLGALAAQLLSYSLLRVPWAALPLQALSGLGSGALRWHTQGTARDVATPGTERALLALLRALGTAGAGLGSLGAGFVVQHLGLPVLLQASCVGLGIWTLFFLIVRSRLPQQRKLNYSQLLAADSSEMSDSEEESEDWLVKAMKDESFNRNWIQQHGIN